MENIIKRPKTKLKNKETVSNNTFQFVNIDPINQKIKTWYTILLI
jgi:hypothetical protein